MKQIRNGWLYLVGSWRLAFARHVILVESWELSQVLGKVVKWKYWT